MNKLNRLRKQLVGIGERKLRLVPCAGIGRVNGKVPNGATDFVWCGFRLLAKRRAVEEMERFGVHLPHGPAQIRVGKNGVGDYVALELDSVPMWDDFTLNETTVIYCHKCGGYFMKNVRADLSRPKRYVRERFPKGQGLLRVNESYVTLASPEFVDLFKRKPMSGLHFREEGMYV